MHTPVWKWVWSKFKYIITINGNLPECFNKLFILHPDPFPPREWRRENVRMKIILLPPPLPSPPLPSLPTYCYQKMSVQSPQIVVPQEERVKVEWDHLGLAACTSDQGSREPEMKRVCVCVCVCVSVCACVSVCVCVCVCVHV